MFSESLTNNKYVGGGSSACSVFSLRPFDPNQSDRAIRSKVVGGRWSVVVRLDRSSKLLRKTGIDDKTLDATERSVIRKLIIYRC